MRKMIALVGMAALISPAAAFGKALSLQDTIRYALDHSPHFDSARKTQSIRELEYKNAVSSFLPSADVTATHGLQNNLAISGPNIIAPNPAAPWFSSLTLSLSENLYDNGESITKLAIADLNREHAKLSYLLTRDSLTLDIAIEFYRLSLATALAEVRADQMAILEKQFKSFSGQYQQGFKTKMDYLRLKTQVQRAEIDLNSAKNAINQSTIELRKIVGQSLADQASLEFEPLPVKNTALSIPEASPPIESAYDYRIAKVRKDINDRNVSFAERRYWPQVSIASGITYSNANYLKSSEPFGATDQLSWSALLTLRYNLWDWGTRRRDVEIAEHNRAVQDNTLDQGVLETNARIKGLMVELSRIRASYRLSQNLVKLEEESNRHLEIQYREGKVTYLDLITSLNSLLDSKVQFFTAYYETLQGLARYRFYEGKIYDTIASQ